MKKIQLRQDGRPFTEYYNELDSTFMELGYRRPNIMECAADVKKQRKRIVEDQVYMFLAGLDHSLDQVSSRVLVTSPLPNKEEAYSLVHHEVQRQVTMGIEDHFEALALTVQRSNKRLWILSKEDDSISDPMDADHMDVEFEPLIERGSRPTRLFQKGYTRQNKDVTVVPPPDSNTPRDDTIMPSDDSSKIDSKLHVSFPIASVFDINVNYNPVTSEIVDLNPQVGNQGRRYLIHDCKEPDRLSFSKSSSNVVYPISYFVSYHRLSKDDIVFKDPMNTFAGIENYKSIFWALRFHGRIFFRALWLDIISVWQPIENVIMVRWTAHGIPRVPWESRSRFDGTSEYKLDKNGKIYEH
ncbi:hypothetical protein ACOSQ2_019462 [Xanthoceras sorbifolium]